MKPKHYKPQYAVAQTVADMQRKFVYPDEDTPAPGLFVGGGGGAPTVVVAPADASELSKGKADVHAAGVNDDDAINAALGMLPFRGGRILITEGTLQCRYGQIVVSTSIGRFVTIQGMGRVSTFLNFTGTTGTGIAYNSGQGEIRDLAIDDDGSGTGAGLSAAASVDWLLDNILFLNSGVGVLLNLTTSTARRARIRSCVFQNGGVGVSLTGSGHTHVGIHNNNFLNTGSHAIVNTATSSAGLLVHDNVINIFLGGGIDAINIGGVFTEVSVMGNHILNSVGRGIVLNSTPNDSIIAGNVLDVDGNGIEVVNGSHSIIANNQIEANEHGIILSNSSGLQVEDNRLHLIGADSDNTYDGIHLAGNSDDNYIHGNKIIPPSVPQRTRYGINVSAATCDCNIVVGNALGDPALYGTDALNDVGTNTQLVYPNDPTYGDNFTDCPPGT